MNDNNVYIFLDIDGVLIPVSGGGSQSFNKRNIDNLNELIRKTDAKIVITSSAKIIRGRLSVSPFL